MNEITLTLNNPLTDEQWDEITDVDFDRTDRIMFHTKHGKNVEFVKNRTGRWIKHEVKLFNGRHTGRYFDECSECGKLTPEWRKVTEYHRWNFCPNCGAKMQEVEE